MSAQIVLTLTGPDRVGLVEEVTGALLDLSGNVETSRMARLGGEFAILMLATLPDDALDIVEASLAALTGAGYKVTVSRTTVPAEEHGAWPLFRIEVHGADHEGIVHGIASGLSVLGINIESAETETGNAPGTGTPLFSMTALVAVPPGLPEERWRSELAEAARAADVDVEVTAAGRG